MSELPETKQNRIKNYDYATPGAYFITICTANREKIFWDCVGADIIRPQNVKLTRMGKITETAIHQIPTHFKGISVDKYCIMPDHIHLILRIESGADGRMISAPTVSTVIGSRNAGFPGKWAAPSGKNPFTIMGYGINRIMTKYGNISKTTQ